MRKNKCAAFLLIAVLFLCGCGAREPVIYAPDAQICAGEEYDELDGVAALDEIDGDLTKQVRLVRGDLDTDRPGRARLTYEVTNSRGFTARASRTIRVLPRNPRFVRAWLVIGGAALAAVLCCFAALWTGRGTKRR